MEFWTHVRACQASKCLAFGAEATAQWLIPIMTTRPLDCVYPRKIE